MAKSRQEKLDELFLLFLEGNGIKKRFFEEYNRQNYAFKHKALPANYMSINCAFSWAASKEGYHFWSNYSDMWERVCSEVKER